MVGVRVFVSMRHGIVEIDKISFFEIYRFLVSVIEPDPPFKDIKKLLTIVT